MFKYHCIYVVLTLFQGVFLQGPPRPLCGPPPHENPIECCKIPQLFSDEERSECGVGDSGSRFSKPDCSKIKCMFNKHNLMKDENNVDKEAMSGFLDKWLAVNPTFEDAIVAAKKFCLKGEIPDDKNMCEPGRIITCMFFVAFDNCPTWEQNEKCDKLKEHIEQCKKNFKDAQN